MSRATPDDQLKFLLSCVRYSNNGKIDFVEVAKECGVVSKGAAAKRYERLLKANGIHPNGGPTEKTTTPVPKQKSRAELARAADAKRRKIENEAYHYQDDDDEDVKPYFKPEAFDMPQIKPEPGANLHSYPWSPMSAPSQQPFFPRPPVPQISALQTFRQPPPPTYNSSFVRFPHSVSQPIWSPTPQIMPPPLAKSSTSSTFPPLVGGLNTPQSSSSGVSEDQINSMFNEFCSQDIFKQPSFDLVSPTQSIKRAHDMPVFTPGKNVQMSPRTVTDVVVPDVLENQVPVPMVKEEMPSVAVQSPMAAIAAEQPKGTAFEDSILITD